MKLLKYISNTRHTYQREVGILHPQALILTFIDISFFFRTSQVHCISLFLLVFAFLTKTTTTGDLTIFFFSISLRKQQIAEISGIYVVIEILHSYPPIFISVLYLLRVSGVSWCICKFIFIHTLIYIIKNLESTFSFTNFFFINFVIKLILAL